jgi:hypothetical protein
LARTAAPTVAVLPFRNLSADPEGDFFADGVTEDFSYVYTGLGDADAAIDWLERACDERAGAIYGIKACFLLKSLSASAIHGPAAENESRMTRI